MKTEVLGEQVVRIATECAKRCGIPENEVEDCAMNFMHRKFAPEDLFRPAWRGEEEQKRLTAMAETYARGHLVRLRKRAAKVVSLTGADGTEASGPAGQLVSREPGPEETLLRRQIKEHVARVLVWLTPAQLNLYMLSFEREERTIDLQETTGRSAEALWKARTRLRARLCKLLVASGMDDAVVADLLNELDRLRNYS